MPALEQGRLWPVVHDYLFYLTDKTAAFHVRRLLIVERKHVVSVIKRVITACLNPGPTFVIQVLV